MKGSTLVLATLAVLTLLGFSLPSVVAGTNSHGMLVVRQSSLSRIVDGYRNTEQDLNAEIEQVFADHGLGSPRTWTAMAEGYLGYVLDTGRAKMAVRDNG